MGESRMVTPQPTGCANPRTPSGQRTCPVLRHCVRLPSCPSRRRQDACNPAHPPLHAAGARRTSFPWMTWGSTAPSSER